MRSNLNCNTWEEIVATSDFQTNQEYDLPDTSHDAEEEITFNDNMRWDLFEIASNLQNDSQDELLGARLIDVACEWEYEGNKFPLMKNIQNFMKTYQENEVRSRNTTYTNFAFSENQKLVLDNLDKQIKNINNNHNSKNVKTRCVVQGKAGSG